MKNLLENYVKDKLVAELNEIENSERGKCSLPITKYERAIIYKYTDDGFESLNESLREGRQISDFGNFLHYSLEKLPNYGGICYRSIKSTDVSLNEYYNALKTGGIICEKSFLSCSKSKLLALYFSNSPLFIIKSKSGKDIEKIAKFGLYDMSGQNEKEILFKHNSKFKVLDILEENGRITILMEEV